MELIKVLPRLSILTITIIFLQYGLSDSMLIENKTEIDACLEQCLKDDADYDRLGNGTFVCREIPNFEPDAWDPCVDQCFGGIIEKAENQTQCFCNLCKARRKGYTNFCLEPGSNATIPRGECDEMVCSGKAKFLGKLCRKSKEDVKSEAIRPPNLSESHWVKIHKDKIETCLQDCESGDAHLERMRVGEYVCKQGPGYGPVVRDSCLRECYSEFKTLAPLGDQVECLINYCKKAGHHNSFCEYTGKDMSIRKDECEELIRAGKVKYYGLFCQHEYDAIQSEAACLKTCENGPHGNELDRLRKGLHTCGYDDEDYAVTLDPCVLGCKTIEGPKEAENQTSCFCDYCKQDEISYMDFCVTPGNHTYIKQDECDSLVCTGKAKYFGTFCESMWKTSARERLNVTQMPAVVTPIPVEVTPMPAEITPISNTTEMPAPAS